MKRLAIGVILTVSLAAVFLYSDSTRTSEYSRLVATGDAALTNEDTFLAIEAFSGAIALRGDAMLAHLRRGETCHGRGDLEAAHRDPTEAHTLEPLATRPLEALGDVSRKLGQHDAAARHYAAYLAIDDSRPSVLYKLAVAHHQAGREALAIPLLRQAIGLAPDMAEAHYLLSLALRDQDRQDAAIEALRQAVVVAPDFTTAREALGAALGVAGRWDERGEQLEALAALEPERSQHDVDLGLAYAGVGRTDMAVLSLGRASEEHPEEIQIYTALGRVWLDIARATEDKIALAKAIGALRSVSPATSSSEALTLLAEALILDGELTDAVATLELATERYPVDPSAFMLLADLVERDGDLAGAHNTVTAYVPAVERLPQLVRIASVSIKLQDHADAAVRLETAAALGSPTSTLLVRLANAHWRAGATARARAVVADGLTQHPESSALVALQRRFD
jgi:tetratricopeptide (TPR) repeat protein